VLEIGTTYVFKLLVTDKRDKTRFKETVLSVKVVKADLPKLRFKLPRSYKKTGH